MAPVLPLLLVLIGVDVPDVPTAAARLSSESLRHHEVMRIDRDFGMGKWELALDGWMPRESDPAIAELRLWWVNIEDRDRRKPFSAQLRRHIEFGFERGADGALSVRMAGDGKEYLFTVELGPTGVPVVFATVTAADGTAVPRCRCERGRLIARRILGLPIGIASLQVRCIDTAGAAIEGTVDARRVENSRPYEPE